MFLQTNIKRTRHSASATIGSYKSNRCSSCNLSDNQATKDSTSVSSVRLDSVRVAKRSFRPNKKSSSFDSVRSDSSLERCNNLDEKANESLQASQLAVKSTIKKRQVVVPSPSSQTVNRSPLLYCVMRRRERNSASFSENLPLQTRSASYLHTSGSLPVCQNDNPEQVSRDWSSSGRSEKQEEKRPCSSCGKSDESWTLIGLISWLLWIPFIKGCSINKPLASATSSVEAKGSEINRKAKIELIIAFCLSFISYQLETWRLLADSKLEGKNSCEINKTTSEVSNAIKQIKEPEVAVERKSRKRFRRQESTVDFSEPEMYAKPVETERSPPPVDWPSAKHDYNQRYPSVEHQHQHNHSQRATSRLNLVSERTLTDCDGFVERAQYRKQLAQLHNSYPNEPLGPGFTHAPGRLCSALPEQPAECLQISQQRQQQKPSISTSFDPITDHHSSLLASRGLHFEPVLHAHPQVLQDRDTRRPSSRPVRKLAQQYRSHDEYSSNTFQCSLLVGDDVRLQTDRPSSSNSNHLKLPTSGRLYHVHTATGHKSRVADSVAKQKGDAGHLEADKKPLGSIRSSKSITSPNSLSLTGAKKRFWFTLRGLSSLSIQRSEEVLPPEASHLVQGVFTSSSDSGNESAICRLSQITSSSEDPRACFVDGLGAGQIASRQALVSPFLGDIQLTLSSRRGMLEVEVIKARGLLLKVGAKCLPYPFVKVYLMKQKKCIAKFKTSAAERTLSPVYGQRFIFREDYSGCVLQVIVWGDFGKKDKKSLMGIAQVHLDDVDISNSLTCWYRLFNAPSMASSTQSSKSLRHTILTATNGDSIVVPEG